MPAVTSRAKTTMQTKIAAPTLAIVAHSQICVSWESCWRKITCLQWSCELRAVTPFYYKSVNKVMKAEEQKGICSPTRMQLWSKKKLAVPRCAILFFDPLLHLSFIPSLQGTRLASWMWKPTKTYSAYF
jgi:hypothetical protein